MIENCPMRHENGNCIPAGGFCTANKNICEALLNAYRMGKTQLSQEDTTLDLISRQWLLDCINEGWIKFDTDKDANRFIHLVRDIAPSAQPEPQWIPVSERLPSKEERKEWIDNNLDGIGYLYPCLVTRYSSINPDRTKNNPYVAKHYFDGEDFLNAGEEVCSEYIIAWMPLPKPFEGGIK